MIVQNNRNHHIVCGLCVCVCACGYVCMCSCALTYVCVYLEHIVQLCNSLNAQALMLKHCSIFKMCQSQMCLFLNFFKIAFNRHGYV